MGAAPSQTHRAVASRPSPRGPRLCRTVTDVSPSASCTNSISGEVWSTCTPARFGAIARAGVTPVKKVLP